MRLVELEYLHIYQFKSSRHLIGHLWHPSERSEPLNSQCELVSQVKIEFRVWAISDYTVIICYLLYGYTYGYVNGNICF